MKRRIIASIAASALVTASAVLGFGTAAHAKTTVFCVQPFNHSGDACFYSDGDKFSVADLFPDGRRAVIIWNTSYGRSGECTDANGANNGWTWCDYDFLEGYTVNFVVVARDGANGKNEEPSNVVTGWTSGR